MNDNKQNFKILLQENEIIEDIEYVRLYIEYETNHGYLQEESVKYVVEDVIVGGVVDEYGTTQPSTHRTTYDTLEKAHIVFQSY